MNPLTHIVEPERLLLTWQPSDEQAVSRTRRVVGEIVLNNENNIVFRYLTETDDYKTAVTSGFKGFPAFRDGLKETNQGVLEAFIRRLPPRNREDFEDFLSQHRLPSPFKFSDMALLGYTGAKLPSDGFSLVPIFPANKAPCDYIMEVAGLRHVFEGNINESIATGDIVSFEIDHLNPVDKDAIYVICNNLRIGYVNRALINTVHNWLENFKINAQVERINGKPDRPLVYVRVSISN